MAESVIQPDTNLNQSPDSTTHAAARDGKGGECGVVGSGAQARTASETGIEVIPQTITPTPTPNIIWTPSFILVFALVLVLGLTVESIVTEGWSLRLYSRDWPLLAHVLVILGLWITIVSRVHSRWIRIGGLFACVWAFFSGFHLVLDLHPIDPGSPIIAHLNAATSIALLGSYICLSLDRTPFRLWDSRFFRFALVVGICATAAAYFLTPPDHQTLSTLESDLVLTAIVLSILVWWIRPSCWKAQPGPTFLFGMAPAILLFLTISNGTDATTNLFLSQVALLCIILGAMRVLQLSNTQSHLSNPQRTA